MKQIIVLCAVFLLIAALLLQIPLEMVNYERRHAIMFYINNAKEMAKQEGCYTNEILDELRSNIAESMKFSNSDEIIIGDYTTMITKYRPDKYDEDSLIYLEVLVPFKNILAASSFYGIADLDGRYYVIEEVATSEKLRGVE